MKKVLIFLVNYVYAVHTKKYMLMRNVVEGVTLPFPYERIRPVSPALLEGLLKRKMLFLPDPEEHDFDPQNLRLVSTRQKLFLWYVSPKENYCLSFRDRRCCSPLHEHCVRVEKPKLAIRKTAFHQLQWKNGMDFCRFFWLQTR